MALPSGALSFPMLNNTCGKLSPKNVARKTVFHHWEYQQTPFRQHSQHFPFFAMWFG